MSKNLPQLGDFDVVGPSSAYGNHYSKPVVLNRGQPRGHYEMPGHLW